MITTKRFHIKVTALCFMLITGLPLTSRAQTFSEGTYALEGYNSLSAAVSYTGTIDVVKDGDVYKLEWNIGEQKQTGVAILDGDILSVGYMDTTAGEIRDMGVVSYRIIDEGKLEGTWCSISGNRTGKEILTLKIEDVAPAPVGESASPEI